MKWNYKRFLKNIGKVLMVLLSIWLMFSMFEFALENTHYASGTLNKYNFFVVVYKWLDKILQGFIF